MTTTIYSRFARLIVCASILLTTAALWAQSFTHTLGGMLAQDGIGAWPTGDGFRIVARNYVGTPHAFEGAIHTTGANGASTSTATISTNANTFLQQVVSATTSDVFAVGSLLRANPLGHDALAIRLSMNGELQWQIAAEQPGAQQFFGGTELPDGGLVACGVSDTGSGHQPLVVRFAADGTVLWTYTGSDATAAQAYAVAQQNNTLIVTGRTQSFSGHEDILLLRLTLDGSLVWSSAFGGVGTDIGKAVVGTGDGRFLLAGYTDSYGTFDQSTQRITYHAYLVAFDLDGDTLWTRTLGDTLFDTYLYALQRMASGDLYLAGERGTSALSDAVLYRTSPTGIPAWQRILDLGKEERLTNLCILSNGILATGWSFGEFGRQVLFIRRDTNGN